jgi:hypothetical protein
LEKHGPDWDPCFAGDSCLRRRRAVGSQIIARCAIFERRRNRFADSKREP